MSSWNALVGEVNNAIAGMNTKASEAGAAAALAKEAAQEAEAAAKKAQDCAGDADEAAEKAEEERAKWTGATAGIRTLEHGEDAALTLSETGGVKHFAFAVPRGEPGADGEKGDPGHSGVTFTLQGTTLYIQRV